MSDIDYIGADELVFNTDKEADTCIGGEFEELKKSPRHTLVHMNCCDSQINIAKLYNMTLCPNCNQQLYFIIEKNTNMKNS